jgi:hypothetical protein
MKKDSAPEINCTGSVGACTKVAVLKQDYYSDNFLIDPYGAVVPK